ncbi:MAG: amino acid permease [Gammaproteobacteria bacterium]|jgi:APA family basic amino acid/polyamine antiporter|nr:amino acid permease [Gammaproteobacteria bacterium]
MQSISDIESAPLPSGEHELRRCLTAFDLTLLGIGGIIGAGIFVLTGIASATQAGPAVIFSYILAGIASGFSALAYAELASSIGGCGSAYGYAYAGMGQFIAWMIGWDLLLEYGTDAATICIGWSGYVQNVLSAFGLTLPKALINDPFHGGIINLPAVFIILVLASILAAGAKEGARFNNIMVYIKLFVIGLFIILGTLHFNPANWHPFAPFGFQGVVNGAALIFFAYIGFDVVSTAGEETVNPKRDLPIGIIASLLICTLIYVIFAGVLTGLTHYSHLNTSSPVATALLNTGHQFAAEIIALGAIVGLTTTILAMYYGFTRVYVAMARDRLLPKKIAKIDSKTRTPRQLIWLTAVLIAIIAGFFPITQIANIVNMGTLAAFMAVSVSVIVLRHTKPDMPRPFKTPWSPVIPVAGILMCFYLMYNLPRTTWISFLAWTIGGLVIYFSYSKWSAKKL